MLTKYSFLLSLLFAVALLQGCASSTSSYVAAEPSAIETEQQPEIPVRPFPTETLYELLVGELAGIRDQP